MNSRELIPWALRLLNVPGVGALLPPDDVDNAFLTLQSIIDTEAVTEAFVPGINTHFFPMVGDRSVNTYGPGGEFDTRDFLDPVPVKIESAYVREGGNIIDNRRVANGRFDDTSAWVIAPAASWQIFNGAANAAPGNENATLSQSMNLEVGVTYELKVSTQHQAGSVTMLVIQDGSTNLVNAVLDSTLEDQLFTFVFTGATAELRFTVDSNTTDFSVTEVSVLQQGRDPLELATGRGGGFGSGTDYVLKIIDQRRYNRRFAKGTGGRPYELLFSRRYPLAEIEFDNGPISGDILIMDVLVNRVRVEDLDEEIRVFPDALKWLRYALASELAPEYGKQLMPQQLRTMDEAWQRMASANSRPRLLEVDSGITQRVRTFDINRGDP